MKYFLVFPALLKHLLIKEHSSAK